VETLEDYEVEMTRRIRALSKEKGISLDDAAMELSCDYLKRAMELKSKYEEMTAAGKPLEETVPVLKEAAEINYMGIYAVKILSAVHGLPW
jgi:hypothetical protein